MIIIYILLLQLKRLKKGCNIEFFLFSILSFFLLDNRYSVCMG